MLKTQKAFIKTGTGFSQIELPPENEEAIPNVKWGNVAGFATVSYWLYKVFEKRHTNSTINYKLGHTLLEEIGACLLGGHGIPASKGLAAYEHMKAKGSFSGEVYEKEQLLDWLSESIQVGDKPFKYRFAKQKAGYLHSALEIVSSNNPPMDSGKSLRDWLLGIKGIGLKTASWIARNWLNANDVAILDIHIYRAGVIGGFFDDSLSVEKNYLELENRFIELANAMGVDTSELDALMWHEMQQSSFALKYFNNRSKKSSRSTTTQNGRTNSSQIAFVR